MPYKETIPKRIYFEIGEVALSAGISPSAVRWWLKEFDLDISKRSKSGKRKFNKLEWERILAIAYLLQIEQYTIPGARIKFKLWMIGDYKIPQVWFDKRLPPSEESDNNIHPNNHESNS